MDNLAEKMTPRPLDIVVAGLTKNRPTMLASLIRSWTELKQPEQTTVRFIIVENDTHPKSSNVVESFKAQHQDFDLHYILEPRPGIPVARNRALDEARGAGADILCFVDDDEEVAPDWLVELVSTYRHSGSVAIGGPVVPKRPKDDLGSWQRRIFSAIEARSKFRYDRISAQMEKGNPKHVTVSTNNCLYDLAVVGLEELRFDENMVWTGGTDAKLSAEIARSGRSLGWSSKAIVWETQPKERLTASYIIRTARDREAVYLERKLAQNRLLLPAFALALALRLALFIVLVPACNLSRMSLYNLLLNTGWILAFLYVIVGKKSALYRNVTGY